MLMNALTIAFRGLSMFPKSVKHAYLHVELVKKQESNVLHA